MIDEENVNQAIYEYAGEKYGQLKDFDDDMDFFWKEGKTLSTIGLLRQKGLMVVGKMVYGERQFKVAFIPNEIRSGLKVLLT